MSVVPTVGPMINCDALGCRSCFEGSRGCTVASEARAEALLQGWRVNLPRDAGPPALNPLPFPRARLDFCPQHVTFPGDPRVTAGYQHYARAVNSGALPPEQLPEEAQVP